jgi:hypothetical protein
MSVYLGAGAGGCFLIDSDDHFHSKEYKRQNYIAYKFQGDQIANCRCKNWLDDQRRSVIIHEDYLRNMPKISSQIITKDSEPVFIRCTICLPLSYFDCKIEQLDTEPIKYWDTLTWVDYFVEQICTCRKSMVLQSNIYKQCVEIYGEACASRRNISNSLTHSQAEDRKKICNFAHPWNQHRLFILANVQMKYKYDGT